MGLPDYQQFMVPLLRYLSDGQPRTRQERMEWVADHLHLSAAQRDERLPSGAVILSNREGWAATYLAKAGLIERTGRGLVQITTRGHKALDDSQRGIAIDTKYLRQFPEFVTFLKQTDKPDVETLPVLVANSGSENTRTPQEAIEAGYRALRATLAIDLLERINAGSPRFFEQLVLDLLVAMGYGGSRADAAQAVGGSGDGGVDGYIKEDKLGLDSIYLQAKRWQGSVGRPIVQAFAGSLEGHRARKGVLITSSKFSQDARDYVQRIEKRIVLIDGQQLTDLMIEHGVGVTEIAHFSIQRIDEDYFEDG